MRRFWRRWAKGPGGNGRGAEGPNSQIRKWSNGQIKAGEPPSRGEGCGWASTASDRFKRALGVNFGRLGCTRPVLWYTFLTRHVHRACSRAGTNITDSSVRADQWPSHVPAFTVPSTAQLLPLPSRRVPRSSRLNPDPSPLAPATASGCCGSFFRFPRFCPASGISGPAVPARRRFTPRDGALVALSDSPGDLSDSSGDLSDSPGDLSGSSGELSDWSGDPSAPSGDFANSSGDPSG